MNDIKTSFKGEISYRHNTKNQPNSIDIFNFINSKRQACLNKNIVSMLLSVFCLNKTTRLKKSKGEPRTMTNNNVKDAIPIKIGSELRYYKLNYHHLIVTIENECKLFYVSQI